MERTFRDRRKGSEQIPESALLLNLDFGLI